MNPWILSLLSGLCTCPLIRVCVLHDWRGHNGSELWIDSLLFALTLPARKAHRNGIKRPKSNRYESLKGVCKMAFFCTQNRRLHTINVLCIVVCARLMLCNVNSLNTLIFQVRFKWSCRSCLCKSRTKICVTTDIFIPKKE